jgi:hypothetical protein
MLNALTGDISLSTIFLEERLIFDVTIYMLIFLLLSTFI